jgi:hypothetical protein
MKNPLMPGYRLLLPIFVLLVVGFAGYGAGERSAMNATLTAASGPLIFSEPIVDSRVSIAIQQARADFAAVVIGRSPIHAKRDRSIPLPADGGTAVFKAPGYTLTVVKSLVQLGGVDGYIYGPVIHFEEPTLSGNADNISRLSFYSRRALQELLGPGSG